MGKKKVISYLGNKQDISIYFNLNCNLKCSYCYIEHMNKSMTFENMEKLLNTINKHETSLSLQILGGEPSLYKHIEYFVNNIDARHDVNFITNGIKTHELNLKFNHPNSILMISLHYEYISEEYFNNIKKTIEKFQQYNVTISINIPDKPILAIEEDNIMNFIKDLTELNLGINYSTNTIIINNEDINNTYTEFSEKLFKILENESVNRQTSDFTIDGKICDLDKVSETYLALNTSRSFKNKCICELGFMEVYPDLNLKYICTGEEICTSDNFFIPAEPKKIICPHIMCNYHCYTNNTKWFF